MYFTYVVRPGEAPEGRGPTQPPCWEAFLGYSLRAGFVLQAAAYLGLVAFVGVGTHRPLTLLGFLHVSTKTVGSTHIAAVCLCLLASLTGLLCHVVFLAVADDDSSIKQSRGYRAGTKFLAQATSFGLVSGTFTLVSFYAANKYFSAEWLDEQIGSGASWLVYYAGRLTDILALLMYAGAAFFLETYHSEGAGEVWGWLVGLAFELAAYAEILGLALSGHPCFVKLDVAYTVLLGLALGLATAWSFLFEPVSQRYDVRLTQSAMRAEYYKSRNAIAYYGPAVVNADGELDIQAAGQQAQQCALC